MRERMLHHAAEAVLRDGFGAGSRLDRFLGRFHDTGSLQRGDFHHAAAQLTRKLIDADNVAVFLDDVHHVDRDNHRDSQLGQLGGQVQVALEVGAVDDIQDGIRPVVDQVIARHHLFERVRR